MRTTDRPHCRTECFKYTWCTYRENFAMNEMMMFCSQCSPTQIYTHPFTLLHPKSIRFHYDHEDVQWPVCFSFNLFIYLLYLSRLVCVAKPCWNGLQQSLSIKNLTLLQADNICLKFCLSSCLSWTHANIRNCCRSNSKHNFSVGYPVALLRKGKTKSIAKYLILIW